MANIKNFGLSGVSGDVQFGKSGGRVVYDAGSSVFKVTQSDGTTLDNLRVATTPVNGNDAASKSYVDSTSAADASAEADARIAADGVLTAAVASEAAARIAADGVLTTNLAAEATSARAAELANANAIAAEAAARIAADGDLTTNLAAEATTARAAELANAVAIDAEETRAKAAEVVLTTNLAAEASTARAAELANANAIAEEETRAVFAEGVLTTNLAAEATTARAAELANANAIDAEETRALAAEVVLTTNLSAEAAARISGDAATLVSAKSYTDGEITTLDGDLRAHIADVASGKDALSELVDVALTASANGDLLMYNSTSSKWENVDVSTTKIDEGTNLYYTDARVDAYVAGGSLSALDVAGNATIDGDLNVGGVLNISGSGTSTFAGDLSINGALTVAAGSTFLAGITGDTMTMSGDLTVAGNTVLTQTATVKSDVDLANASALVNVFHVTSSVGEELFEIRQNGDAVVGGSLTINGEGATLAGGLSAGDITAANADFTGNVSINGNLTVDGESTFIGEITGNDMTLKGNLIIGDADTDFVTINADVNSNIIPDVSLTYDLGSATKKWNNIHVGTVNATSLIGSLTGQVSSIANHEAYIEGLFSVVDNGGDGSLSYANGVITYTGPSAAEVRAHFSAGTGVHYAAGEFSIGQAVETSSDVTFNDVTVSGSLYSNDITASEVTINGNLTVTGTTTTVNTETIELADNIIVFNSNATGAATQDAGIEIERGDDANVTLLWDETANRWTVGDKNFVAANFFGNLTGDVTGQVSSIANHNTDALVEGSVNLYYTDGRVAAYLLANAFATEAYTDAKVADKDSFAIRASLSGAGSIGSIVNVAGKAYYVSRIVVDVTSAFDAEISITDGTNTLMGAASIEENVVGAYVAEMDFATATAGGASISLATAATAGAATVTVEYIQM